MTIEMSDLKQEFLRKKRLKGCLKPVMEKGLGERMAYVQDAEIFLHPTAQMLLDESLTSVLEIIEKGRPDAIEYFDEA